MTTQRFRFERFWLAAVCSNLGDGLVLAAFPLLAATMTDEPISISLIAVAMGLPWLLFGPVSGAIVDRFDKRILMVSFDTGRAVCLAVFALLVLSGRASLGALLLVVFVIATGETVVDTSSQSMLPALVPKSQLDVANGKLFSTMTVAHRFVGPPLGGLLFGIAAVAPVAADGASFAVAAVLIFTLSGRFKVDSGNAHRGDGLAKSILEGLRWLWGNRPIRTFAVGAALLNIGIMAGEAILVLFATDQLSLTGVGFGSLFAALALGYAGGSAMAPRLTSRIDRLLLVTLSVVVISISLAGIAVSGHWLPVAAGLFGIGSASGIWDVIAVSFRQAAVPDRLLGRTMAAYRVIAHGSAPIGALLGGVAARLGGNRSAFLLGSIVVLVAVFYVSRNLRNVDLDPARVGGSETP
jgi:MFS family permease